MPGVEIALFVFAALGGLGGLAAFLTWLGILPRDFLAWASFLAVNKKLYIALGLFALSWALCGTGIYIALHRPTKTVNKIVERPVDRVVEKIIPADCPKPSPVKRGSQKPVVSANPIPVASPVVPASASPEVLQPKKPDCTNTGWVGINVAGKMDNSSIGDVHMKNGPPCATAVKVGDMKNGSHVDKVEMEKEINTVVPSQH